MCITSLVGYVVHVANNNSYCVRCDVCSIATTGRKSRWDTRSKLTNVTTARRTPFWATQLHDECVRSKKQTFKNASILRTTAPPHGVVINADSMWCAGRRLAHFTTVSRDFYGGWGSIPSTHVSFALKNWEQSKKSNNNRRHDTSSFSRVTLSHNIAECGEGRYSPEIDGKRNSNHRTKASL